MKSYSHRRQFALFFAFFSVFLLLIIAPTPGMGAERVLKLDTNRTPIPNNNSTFGNNSSPEYRYTPFRLGVPFGSGRARDQIEEANSGKIRTKTFTVYTTDESYQRSEIDSKVAAVSQQVQDTAAAAKRELGNTKADLLKAVSASVGRQLSAEELSKIKAALLPEIRMQLKAEIADELRTSLKAEILQELRKKEVETQ